MRSPSVGYQGFIDGAAAKSCSVMFPLSPLNMLWKESSVELEKAPSAYGNAVKQVSQIHDGMQCRAMRTLEEL